MECLLTRVLLLGLLPVVTFYGLYMTAVAFSGRNPLLTQACELRS